MPLTFPSFRRSAVLALAVIALHAPTARLAAQRSAADARIIDGYRLSMPVLRRVLPALSAATPACRAREKRDPHTLSIAEMTRSLEQCPPVMESLRRAGVPPRDAAIVFGSMLSTAMAMALGGGKVDAVPAGPLRDNALLLQENEDELGRLSRLRGTS